MSGSHLKPPNVLAEAIEQSFRDNTVRVAVEHDGSVRTYSDLDLLSSELSTLVASKTSVGELVAVQALPSYWGLAAVIAVARVGRTWLAVDPLVGTDVALRAGVAAWLDTNGLVRTDSQTRPSDGVAYVLTTSGSTGEQKLVAQTWANCMAHSLRYISSLGARSCDRMALLTPIGFDAGLMDALGSVLSGARLSIFDPRRRRWSGLKCWMRSRDLSLLHCTPTLLRLAFQDEYRFPSLRAVTLGGEVATQQDLSIFRRIAPAGATFINGYGPSECTKALEWRADSSSQETCDPLPIGLPVPGVGCEVAHGELVLSGDLLAQYWTPPARERCRFWVDSAGLRCWSSGDRAERRGDGLWVATGRIVGIATDIRANGKAAVCGIM
jgi:acyl-coenzyme A synthetase/AMP-(fatty) acid ligase